jgi:hypothetical protein
VCLEEEKKSMRPIIPITPRGLRVVPGPVSVIAFAKKC